MAAAETTNKKMPSGVKTFADDFYVVAGTDGSAEFYQKDPLKPENRASQFDIGEMIFDIMDGPSDVVNPIKMRVLLYRVKRGEKFNFQMIEKAWESGSEIQIGDMEGHVVEITRRFSSNAEFPYNGVIYNESGEIVEHRLYAPSGDCIDGNPDHGLIFIKTVKNK